MMILTVVVVAVFKTTIQLGNAYGKTSLHGVNSAWLKQDCTEYLKLHLLILSCNVRYRAL